MKVPRDDQGRPRFSITQFRTYGGTSNRFGDFEEPRGCPLLYRLTYVEHSVPERVTPVGLRLGSVLHDALHRMERDTIGPEDALSAAGAVAELTFEEWQQAREILARWLERDEPTHLAPLAQEITLEAQLADHPRHGPIMFRGRLDRVDLDLVEVDTVHGIDYKGSWQPPSSDAVERDAQLMSQHWLLSRCYRQLGFVEPPRVVMHIAALRYRDHPTVFSDDRIQEWQDWATDLAGRILDDEQGRPALNDGCSWCPAHALCPAWSELPGTAAGLAARVMGSDIDELAARLAELTLARKLVGDAYTETKRALDELAHVHGEVEVGDRVWRAEPGWADEVDFERLHRVLGADAFYRVVTTSRAAIERGTDGRPALRAAALDCITRVPSGTTITRRSIT